MDRPRYDKTFNNFLVAILFVLTGWLATPGLAQVTNGNIRGIVQDATGAVVAGAKITLTDKQTNKVMTGQSNDSGEFLFVNLPPGLYEIKIEATNFTTLLLTGVRVELNRTTDVLAKLEAGGTTDVVEITATGVGLVQTSSNDLARSYEARQVVELGQTTVAGGIYNLALTVAGVSSGGGLGVGTGGSVGGQRPRNNNFMVDGIDNNDKSVTGPQIYISPEAVAEFTLLTNQFGAEFSRSNGGQFITVTKSGTNAFHGTAYFFLQNRNLNALGVREKEQGITRDTQPRFDYSRYGSNVGGPIVKDRLFFFTQYEGQQTGSSATAGGIIAPTQDGYALLSSIPGLSATNLNVLRTYLPAAPTADPSLSGRLVVAGRNIPVGFVAIQRPAFRNQRNFVFNLDFVQSERMTHRTRFIFDRIRAIDTGADLPAFFISTPTDGRLFSYTNVFAIQPNLTNEFRFSFRRSRNELPVPDIPYPGLDSFPNIELNDLGVNIGPNGVAPQFGIENNYQLVENITWVVGNHTLKFGIDTRRLIAPQSFVQRQRGDYFYLRTESFLRDLSPEFGERTVGVSPYYGNQWLFFGFAQDSWRIRPDLTFNYGFRYSYQQVPFTARLQRLNRAASVPGLISFDTPAEQKTNFAPVIGLAYAPNFSSGLMNRLFGNPGASSIRAGFSMGYDIIFDNLYILSLPPQFNQTRNVEVPGVPGFLAGGGLPPTPAPVTGTPEQLRAITSSWIPDQKVPYAITWTLGIQRQFFKDWAAEVRYVGTRGVHLLTQNRINRQPRVTPQNFIPTFLNPPTPAQLAGLPTLAQVIAARSNFVPAFAAAGFNAGNLVAFLSNGNSTYHGLQLQLQKRLTQNYSVNLAYTFSKLIDDTTAELFSTVLASRRVQDFQNLRAERSLSLLDSPHRLAITANYDLPFFLKSANPWLRSLLGGFSVSGTYSYETGKPFTARSGVDSNLNGDNAGDRTILNPNGQRGTGSGVRAINALGQTVPLGNPATVAYVALNPNAQYIVAGPGALATAGRNTLRVPAINNFDIFVRKNFRITEEIRAQFRADFFNAFNHPQFVPGSVNGVNPVTTTATPISRFTIASDSFFNRPRTTFGSNPRVIQLALRIDF